MDDVEVRSGRDLSSSRRDTESSVGEAAYIWRHHSQAMRDWYASLVDAVIAEVNARQGEGYYRAGASIYNIKTTVSLYGLPHEFLVGTYYPLDQSLIVTSPRIVEAATKGVRSLGLNVHHLSVEDSTQNPEVFFGDLFFDELYGLARQSGRALNDRTRAQLPQVIQNIIDDHFRIFEGLAIPASVREELYEQIGRKHEARESAIPSACAVCGPREISQVFMCQYCARDATVGLRHIPSSHAAEAMRWGMSQLATEFGGAFSRKQTVRLPDVALPNWSVQAVARMTCHAGDWSWSERLVDSGVTADGTRPSWGMYSRAIDGHWCRSLLERQIDDFFHHHGIPHEPEPKYPHDPEVNPRERFRADWKLADGTFVKAFGALGRPDYAKKAEIKRQLAARHNIPLIELTASDTHRLDDIFQTHLPAEPRLQKP